MGYLRQIQSALPKGPGEASCVAVYQQELDYLFETLQRLGASSREIEDLAHEVFLVLLRNWAELDLSLPIRPYLFAIVFRVVCAHRRRRRREVPCGYVDAEDQGTGPEERLQSKESTRLIITALDTVPLPRRAVIVMHDLDGIPLVEVAAQLSLTRFGAYKRLRKARKELASAMRRLLRGRVTR